MFLIFKNIKYISKYRLSPLKNSSQTDPKALFGSLEGGRGGEGFEVWEIYRKIEKSFTFFLKEQFFGE